MSLVATMLTAMQPDYSENMDKNENRASRYGVYDLFKRQTESESGILTPEVRQMIKGSFGRDIQIPVYLNSTPTIGNVRTCAMRAGDNTTAMIGLTFATVAFGFSMYPAEYYGNQMSYDRDFAKKINNYRNAFMAQLENLTAAKLNIEKNIYWPAGSTAIYPQAANALQVSKSGTEDFYNNAQSILELMDYYGDINVVASTMHQPVVRRLMAQGAGNDVNDAFQFDPYRWTFSNRILNGAGIASTAYLVQDDTLAIENRNDPDAILGHTAGVKEWDEVEYPGTGLIVGSYYNADCTDASARATMAGLTRTKVESFEFSTDITLVTAFNSNPAGNFAPIVKAEFSAS